MWLYQNNNLHALFPARLLYPHWAKERAQDQKENAVNVLLSEDHSISGTISLNYSVPNIEALALINKNVLIFLCNMIMLHGLLMFHMVKNWHFRGCFLVE